MTEAAITHNKGRVDLMVKKVNGREEYNKIPDVKAYGKTWGAICRFFGKATKVTIEAEKVYVNTKSLIKHIYEGGQTYAPNRDVSIDKDFSKNYKNKIVKLLIEANKGPVDLPKILTKAMKELNSEASEAYDEKKSS
jgi:hypothetical protein